VDDEDTRLAARCNKLAGCVELGRPYSRIVVLNVATHVLTPYVPQLYRLVKTTAYYHFVVSRMCIYRGNTKLVACQLSLRFL
jgi:hypothetical protein